MNGLDVLVSRIGGQKEVWASMSVREKIEIIDMLMDGVLLYVDILQDASLTKRNGEAVSLKNSDVNDGADLNINGNATRNSNAYSFMPEKCRKVTECAAKASTYLTNTMLLSNWLSVIRESYDALERTGTLPPPMSTKPAKLNSKDCGNLQFVKVGPKGLLFSSLMTGGTMELLIDGPVEQENPLKKIPGLTAILGAGNVDAPIEILMSLFVENRVCIYKPNPLNSALDSPLQKLFAPLIERGFLGFINLPNEQVQTLLNHPLVDQWYMTGSVKTASLILWGQPEPPRPSNEAKLLVKKPFVVELGNCTPWIVCPGIWSRRELDWHASEISAALCFNGAHICAHPQLLVTCKNWPQRDEFLSLIRKHLAEVRYVGCYYGNYRDKMESVKKSMENLGLSSEQFSIPVKVPMSKETKQSDPEVLIFVADLPNKNIFATDEVFVPACGETSLNTESDFCDFLSAAVTYVNEHVHGTLSVAISAKPKTSQEQALDEAIMNLNYGSVHINVDTKLAYAFPSLIWGGAPGATKYELMSGIGFFGNAFGFKRPVKSVVRAPFLNFTHMLFANPTDKNAQQMQKLWRRISLAVAHRRSTESWFGLSARVSKIMSAFVANL